MSTAKRIFAKIYELLFGRLIKTPHRHTHTHTHTRTHNKVESQQEADADAVAIEYEAAVEDKDTTAHIGQK